MTFGKYFLCALAASASSSAIAQAVDAPPPSVEQIEQPTPAVPAADAERAAEVPVAEVPVTSAPPPADPSAEPVVIKEEVGGIGEIVVTATRREEKLQRIPVTVTAITGKELASAGIADTQSLTQGVPGLLFSRSGSGGHPVIRGVGPTGASSNGDEPNVATYIDGVYQPDAYATLMELVEVQRVEVLRGPQGTVFGRNATGGLINIITPDPSFRFRGKLAASYGRLRNDADDLEARGYVTGPIVNNKVAADFAFLVRDLDGHIKDLVNGGTVGGKRIYDVRSKLLMQFSESAKAILTMGLTDYDSSDNAGQPVDNNTIGRSRPGVILADGPWESSFDIRPRADYNRFNLSLRTSFDLGAVNLETTGAYLFSKVSQFADSDSSNIPVRAAGPFFKTKTYSQEIRLLSASTEPLSWLVGFYAFHLDSPGVAILATAGPTGAYGTTVLEPDVKTTSYAGFAEGTYQVAEPLFITLGARYTTEKRSLDMVISGPVPPGTIREFGDKFTINKFTYRGALRYQITDDTNFYASYGTGFKSGVFNTVTTRLNRTDPETIKAIEAGIKSDISRNLRVNLSAYHYTYEDMQVSARALIGTTFAYILQNAASSKIYGGEIEITAAPTRQLTISASGAYIHGRYDEFPAAQTFVPLPNGGNAAVAADASGNIMQKAPKFTFNLAPRWESELGAGMFDASANIFYSSKVYWDFGNNFSSPAHTVVNGQLGYTLGAVRFSLTGTNLTNEEALQQLRVGPEAADMILIRPREIRVGAEWKF